MRFHILGLALPLALVGQQNTNTPSLSQGGAPPPVQVAETKPEDRCGIEGQILNSATGEPVKKANLVLRRADWTPSAGSFPPSYTTASDASDKFSMKNLESGKYP